METHERWRPVSRRAHVGPRPEAIKERRGFKERPTDSVPRQLTRCLVDGLIEVCLIPKRSGKGQCWGHFSGAGKVSIGIHRNRIIALKKENAGPASLGDPVLAEI
jgi:hypothetical protein